MRWMMIVVAAALFAAPVAGQSGEPAVAGAWMRMPVPDARLRVELAPAPAGESSTEWRTRLSAAQWGLLGAAAGCLGGALALGSTAREGEVAALRFNGCIAGGAVGGFLGGVYGLLTGG
jgi:hypothetical protein